MFSNLKQLLIKAAWAPFIVLFVHNGISRTFGHKPSLDPAMHFLGGVALAYFFYHVLVLWSTWFGESKLLARYIIAFSFTATVAVFWEFGEFYSGLAMGVSSQLSIRETMEDLILGCSGAFLLLTIVALVNLTKRLTNAGKISSRQ